MSEPIILTPGDTPTLRFLIATPPPDSTTDGDPFDLTDYNIDFFVKRSMQDGDEAAVWHGELNDGIVISFTVKDGQVDVRVAKSVAEDMLVGRLYPWYLKIQHSVVTEREYVVARGTFLTQFPRAD